MKDFILKVDRVKSIEEASLFEHAGFDVIGFAIAEDTRFKDSRVVSPSTVLDIRKELITAKIAIEFDVTKARSADLELLKAAKVDYVQPTSGRIQNDKMAEYLKANGIDTIYGGNEVAHDDDPSWVLSDYEGDETANVAYYQIDLLPEMNNSWNFLKYECPKYEEELQITDIRKIAHSKPLVVTTDFSRGNIVNIRQTLANVKGFYFVLGEWPNREDMHFFRNPDEIVGIVKAL